jgi:hypothetical protein
MDWTDHRLLDRLRNHLSPPVLALSSSPAVRRRLYGALLLALAAALGLNSTATIRERAVLEWQARHPPAPRIWRAAAASRGLRSAHKDYDFQKWMRHMPRDTTPGSVWWDGSHRALWILPDGSDESPLQLFTLNPQPVNAPPSLRPLGVGWAALEEFESVSIHTSPIPERKPTARTIRDPREWNF